MESGTSVLYVSHDRELLARTASGVVTLELGAAGNTSEPTDNLDLESADALQQALAAFEGAVVTVTRDRWFVRDVDRFLVFGGDGGAYDSEVPVWDETRVDRQRGEGRSAARLPAEVLTHDQGAEE